MFQYVGVIIDSTVLRGQSHFSVNKDKIDVLRGPNTVEPRDSKRSSLVGLVRDLERRHLGCI